MSIPDTLEILRDAGLGCNSRAAARKFSIRLCATRFAGERRRREEWLDIHRTWHRMGGRSTGDHVYGPY